MRLTIRVRPGAARVAVGGSYGAATGAQGSPGPALVVRVTERAVDGRATAAALRALADALSLRPYQVTLVSGATSRTKVVDADGADPARVAALLRG